MKRGTDRWRDRWRRGQTDGETDGETEGERDRLTADRDKPTNYTATRVTRLAIFDITTTLIMTYL
jgi:hypothetical protein